MGFREFVHEAVSCFLDGLLDSVSFSRILPLNLFGSLSKLWPLMAHNLFFWVSYVLYTVYIIPWTVSLCGATSGEFFELFLYFVLAVVWLVPLWLYSVYANALWHAGFAAEAIKTKQGARRRVVAASPSSPSLQGSAAVVDVTDILYKLVVYNLLLLLSFLSGYFPLAGPIIQNTLYAWLYSVYCFEFKWRAQGLSLLQCIEFFEIRWLYFVGFGTPLTILAASQYSVFASYPLTNVFIPFFVATALYGTPSQQTLVPRLRMREISESMLRPFVASIMAKRKAKRDKKEL